MSIKSIEDLLIEDIKDIYNAEKQITKILPKFVKTAVSDELKSTFENHLKQTERQIERLESVFKELDVVPKGKRCVGMEGIINESKNNILEDSDPNVIDAALIAAAQKVGHYEIASYGTVRTYAQQLGLIKVVNLLEKTLLEEERIAENFTSLAINTINDRYSTFEDKD